MKTTLHTNSTNEGLISRIDTLLNSINTDQLDDDEDIIGHGDLSNLTCRIINDLIGTNINGSQCFGIATLGILAMSNGKEGRARFVAYLVLMKEILNLISIYNLVSDSNSIINLISKICKNEFPDKEQTIGQADGFQHERNEMAKNCLNKIKQIDPDYQLLRDVPSICLTHYIYNYQENMPKFGELTETNSPLDDQNFIQIQHALANISFNTKFSNQLKRLFPNYQTLNGQSLSNDFKRIQTLWTNPNNQNGGTSQNNVASLLSVGLYNKDEIRTYFNCLRRAIESGNLPSNENIQLLTYTTSHTTGVSFDNHEKKWYIADSLELTPKKLYGGLTESEVADALCNCLSNDISAGFVALLYANSNVHNSIIATLKNDRQWRGIQNFNRDSLLTTGNNEYYQRIILDFVAAANNDEMTRKIIASKNFPVYINRRSKDFLNYIINKNDGSLDIILSYITNKEVIEFIISEIMLRPVNQIKEFFAKYPKFSPIGLACSCKDGNIQVIELLLHTVDKNTVGSWGRQVLNHLIENQRIATYPLAMEIFNKVLAMGADINAPDELGKTLLMNLCKSQNEISATDFKGTFEFLLSHGADIYHTDNQDHDVLFCADDHVRDYVLSKYNIDVLIKRANSELKSQHEIIVLQNILSFLYQTNPDIIASIHIKINPDLEENFLNPYCLSNAMQDICIKMVNLHPDQLVTFLIKNNNIKKLPGDFITSFIHDHPELLSRLFQCIMKEHYSEEPVTSIIYKEISNRCHEQFSGKDLSMASPKEIEELFMQAMSHNESSVAEKKKNTQHDTKLNHRIPLKQRDKNTMFKSLETTQKQMRAQAREVHLYNLRHK